MFIHVDVWVVLSRVDVLLGSSVVDKVLPLSLLVGIGNRMAGWTVEVRAVQCA